MNMLVKLLISVLLVSVSLIGNAYAQTYYIDFAGGSDANDGTSKTSPWKRHPYMAGWAGGSKYAHAAGDRFIFKGGVTWDRSSFDMQIAANGTNSAPDYYGVDQSWFSGSSWTRPVFDGQHSTLARGSSLISIANRQNVTIDNIEIKRLQSPSNWGVASIALYCSQNILMTNLWVHDWTLAPGVATDDTHGGIIGNYPSCSSAGTWVDHSEISNAERTGSGRQTGGATRAVNIRYSKIHDVSAGMLFGQMHNSEMYNIGYPSGNQTFDNNFHTNALYIEGWEGTGVTPANPALIYNNYIHDISTGSGAIYPNPCNARAPIYIFNNVVKRSTWLGVVNIDTWGGGAAGSCGEVYVYNNTFQIGSDGNGFRDVRVTGTGSNRPPLTKLVMLNNHSINDNGFYGGGNVSSLTNNNNISQTNAATASLSTQSYVYYPSSTSSTIKAGANLTANCGGIFSALCSDTTYSGTRTAVLRPASGAWDVGAYQSGGSGGSSPATPTATTFLPATNLKATVVTK